MVAVFTCCTVVLSSIYWELTAERNSRDPITSARVLSLRHPLLSDAYIRHRLVNRLIFVPTKSTTYRVVHYPRVFNCFLPTDPLVLYIAVR